MSELVLTLQERVAWAIVLAPHRSTREWAIRWLSGVDHSPNAAGRAWQQAEAVGAPVAVQRAAQAAQVAWEVWNLGSLWRSQAEAERDAAEVIAAAAASRLMPALTRARAILAGEYPAERYDGPLSDCE